MIALRELPGNAYTDPEFAKAEAETIFRRNWTHVASGFDLPDAGDVFPTWAGGLPIVLVRQRDGGIAGFHNVCRHRGCLLITEPQRQRPLLTCKFHAWAYGLDGMLRKTPYWTPEDGSANPTFDPRNFSLLSIATAVWCDQIFVRLSADGPGFDAYIAPLAKRWATYDLSRIQYGFHQSYEVAANWKLVVQNFLDTLHLPFLHPQLGPVESARNYDDVNEGDVAMGICYRAGGAEKEKGDRDMPKFPGLSAELTARQDILVLYPNTLVELVAGHILFIRIDPAGPALSREVVSGYFVGPIDDPVRWAKASEGLKQAWDRLNQQDFSVVTAWQAGQHSPAAANQPELSPVWESSGGWFRARVAREMGLTL